MKKLILNFFIIWLSATLSIWCIDKSLLISAFAGYGLGILNFLPIIFTKEEAEK